RHGRRRAGDLQRWLYGARRFADASERADNRTDAARRADGAHRRVLRQPADDPVAFRTAAMGGERGDPRLPAVGRPALRARHAARDTRAAHRAGCVNPPAACRHTASWRPDMRDRRSVDDLSIEELEQILRIKKREARLARLERYERTGRRRGDLPLPHEIDVPGEEMLDEAPQLPHRSFLYEPAETGSRRLRDRLLLGVELLAVVGLVAVLVVTFNTLRGLNRDASAEQAEEVAALPTLEPTPLIR